MHFVILMTYGKPYSLSESSSLSFCHLDLPQGDLILCLVVSVSVSTLIRMTLFCSVLGFLESTFKCYLALFLACNSVRPRL